MIQRGKLKCFHCDQQAIPRLVVSVLLSLCLVPCLPSFIVHLKSNGAYGVEANPDANRLYEDLMMSYNRFVRPVQNDSDTLLVKLGLKLSQLIDVVSDLWVRLVSEGERCTSFEHILIGATLRTEPPLPDDDHNCLGRTGVDRLQAQVGPGRLRWHHEGESHK